MIVQRCKTSAKSLWMTTETQKNSTKGFETATKSQTTVKRHKVTSKRQNGKKDSKILHKMQTITKRGKMTESHSEEKQYLYRASQNNHSEPD